MTNADLIRNYQVLTDQITELQKAKQALRLELLDRTGALPGTYAEDGETVKISTVTRSTLKADVARKLKEHSPQWFTETSSLRLTFPETPQPDLRSFPGSPTLPQEEI